MSTVSPRALSLATKLAAEQLQKNQEEIATLKKTVTAQASDIETTAQRDKAMKIATTLIVGEDLLEQIEKKAESLLHEDLEVVEKAIDLGLTHGLKLGQVMDNGKIEKSTGTEDNINPLIDFLVSHASNSA